jgi:hypothetical protein
MAENAKIDLQHAREARHLTRTIEKLAVTLVSDEEY